MHQNTMIRTSRWWRGLILGILALAPAGCRFTCDADADAGRADNSAKDVVDEIGDEVEDVVEEAKEDRP